MKFICGIVTAEREGFEPPVLINRTTAFEAAALSQALPPLQNPSVSVNQIYTLASAFKKVNQEGTAIILQYASLDCCFVGKPGIGAYLIQRSATTLLFVVASKNYLL